MTTGQMEILLEVSGFDGDVERDHDSNAHRHPET
jgi:hypothetical protein